MNASLGTKHLWTILTPPEFRKVYHIYLLSGSSEPRKQLTVTAAYEAWQFARPIDFLNWLEEQSQSTPESGGLR